MEESPQQEAISSDANGHSDDSFDEQTQQIIQSCKELPATADITNWEMSPVDLMETNKKFNLLSDHKKISKITKKECMKCFIQAHGMHVPLPDIETIWSLSDLDKDDHLNFGEFAIAIFLLHQRLKGRKVPKSLPSDWTGESGSDTANNSQHDNNNNNHTTQHVFNSNSDSPRKSLERGNSSLALNGSRASGLPPKSKIEMQKHMKEAEEIQKKIQKQLALEEKERERKEAIRAAREKRIQEATIFWKDVIATWPQKKTLPKTKTMWWHGFPSSVRGHLWTLVIANDLNITEELFEIFGGHAKSAREKKGTTLGREDTVDLIPVDLPRTFPALSIFQENGPCHGQLRDVLEAYVCFRPDVGYVQGMSYMAAVFLLNLDPFSAFKCLTNILNRSMFLTFFRMNEVELARYFHAYEMALSQTYSKLYKHLKQFEFNHMTYLVDWVMTMYSKALPIDISSRIWDVYFGEGEYFIFRTAIGLLKYLGPKLEKAPFDDIVKVLHHLPATMDEDELFACIEKVDLTAEKWQKLLDAAAKKK